MAETSQLEATGAGRALTAAAVGCAFIASTTGQLLPTLACALCLAFLAYSRRVARERGDGLWGLSCRVSEETPLSVPRGLDFTLNLRLSPSASWPVRDLELAATTSMAGALVHTVGVVLQRQAVGEIGLPMRLPRAGLAHVHGVGLRASDSLGLFVTARWVPLEQTLLSVPKRLGPSQTNLILRAIGAVKDREGRHLERQTGSGLELRELREYVPGDALRSVAWKATARRQRPLVRAFEDETLRRIQVLVDMSPSMRFGPPGGTPLDTAVDLIASLAAAAQPDFVGLTVYDHRVFAHLKPDVGRFHVQRLTQQLLDLFRVVDEDLTCIADAELGAVVGNFLHQKVGTDLRTLVLARVRPNVLAMLTDPLRELYDEAGLFTEVSRALSRDRDRGQSALFAKSRPAVSLASARMRLYCAINGIELPYRLISEPGDKDRGLAAAVAKNLLAGSADALVVISDFESLDVEGAGMRALRSARARKKQVAVVPVGLCTPALTRRLAAVGLRVVEPRLQR
ncbi:MAG: DUF58 domain-containing protein [Myxococcales bacterium]|nr:DUF58 domain-containing protein [Myxococcales bacterium]